MNPPIKFAQNNPLAVSATGATSGFVAWLIAHGDAIVTIFQIIGGFFGCLLAVVSFAFVLPKLIRFCRRAWVLGLERADQGEAKTDDTDSHE